MKRASDSQRGSALLIVFVFAAFVAIMLYREMPVAAFEAHRQKEELLIDRGNEYKHAVKLFVRKLGTFPPSMEALENTNRMRFLRHKFQDPLTGKDDWRILHAGVGGMIVDSKVKINKNAVDANGKPIATNQNSSQNPFQALSQNSTSTTNSGFTGFGASNSSSDNSSSGNEATVPAVPQRPPAVAANSSPTGNSDLSVTAAESGLPTESIVPATTTNSSMPGTQGAAQQANAAPPGIGGGLNAQNTNNSPNANTANAAPNSPTDAQGMMQSMLNRGPNPVAMQTPQQQSSNRSGTIMNGGIAGVASKAHGHSIKLVNDQDDFSLWEFYYDMAKEANANMAAALAGRGQNGNVANSNGMMNSPSGMSNTNSPTSNSGGFSLSLGNNNSSSSTTQTTPNR